MVDMCGSSWVGYESPNRTSIKNMAWEDDLINTGWGGKGNTETWSPSGLQPWILTLTHAEFPLQTTAESKRKKLQTPFCTLVSHFEREKKKKRKEKKKCVVNLMRKFQDMSYDCSYLSPRRHRWFISATKLLLTPRNADEKNKFISGLHSESLTLVMRKPS